MSDTIVASATAWGQSALAVVRLSGPRAVELVQLLSPGGPPWVVRRATLRRLVVGGQPLDEAVVTWFQEPASYTGEELVELSCHGSPLVVATLLEAAVALGARPARAGEFTRRAVENGRMDLLGAESVPALIEATSREGIAIALAARDGALSHAVANMRERLLDGAAELEARLDVGSGDLGYDSDAIVIEQLRGIALEARTLAESWKQSRVRIAGARVALLGEVNAGKSSLFNRLVRAERALVSPKPGTTRDVVERTTVEEGLQITWLDTAGERESIDEIELAGIALGRAMAEEVDLQLLLLPLNRPEHGSPPRERPTGPQLLRVGTFLDQPPARRPPEVDLALSSLTGEGVEALRSEVRRIVGQGSPTEHGLQLTSLRQQELFAAVSEHAQEAAMALGGMPGPAVAAQELALALDRLAELDGHDVREGVLDRLFARFCVGK